MSTGDSPKTLTVLHIFSGDLWAGAEVMVFNLLNRLNEYRDVKLIAFSMNEGTLTQKLRSLEIETHVFPEDKYSFWKIWGKALKVAWGKDIAIIHSHRYKENLLAFLLGRCLGIKLIIATIHGLSESFSTGGKNEKPSLISKINCFIMRNFFSRVVAVSENIREILIEKHRFKPEKIILAYNGIDTSNFPSSEVDNNSDSFHVGTVGRMVPVKDFELFLQIAAELRNHLKNIRFSILGDGPLKERLEKSRLRLNLGDCLEFIQPVTDPFPFYRSLDLYLNTSIHEGLPLTILEAMTCGLPIVAPRVGGIPEIIDQNQNGILFEDRDPAKIAQTCFQILSDKNSRVKMGKKAEEKVQHHFSAVAMADNYHRLYLS